MFNRQAIDKPETASARRSMQLPAIVLFFSVLFIPLLSAATWTNVNPDIDSANRLFDKMARTDSNDIRLLQPELERFHALVGVSQSHAAEIQSLYWDAEIAYIRDGMPKEVNRLLGLIGSVDSVAMTYEWFRIEYLRLKVLLYLEKDYTRAYTLCETLLDNVRALGLGREEGILVATEGLLFYFIDDFDEALRLQQMARKLLAGTCSKTDSLRNELNVCNTLAAMGHFGEAEHRLAVIADDSIVSRHHKLYCNVMMSLFHFTHKPEYAVTAHEQALMTADSVLIMKSLQNLADMYYGEGEVNRCIDTQKKVFRFFYRRNDPDMIVPLKGLVDIYRRRGQRDSVLRYLDYLVAAQDTFNNLQNAAIISRMRAHNEIRGLKDRIEFTETRASLERDRSYILAVLCAVLLLLGVGVVFYLRRRSATERKVKALENQQLALCLQNERLRNEQYRQAIDSRERELSSKALQLLNKNEMLNELLEQIHSFSLPAALEQRLVRKINEQLNGEKYWDDFTAHFEQVNPQFFKDLKERYPSLTDKDLKLCAYIKIGFSAKQIAQMLSVLPESVNTTRYRLRRKMGLPPEIALEDHLREI